MKKILALIFSLTVCYTQLVAQNNHTVPNTLIVKFKKETSNAIENGRLKASDFSQLFDSMPVQKFKQILPHSTVEYALQRNSKARVKAPQNIGKYVDLSSIYEITFSELKDSKSIIKKLKNSGLVEYAEPKYTDQVLYIPNDPEAKPGTGKQYQLALIKAYEAWEIEKGDSNVFVGVVDTDINLEHPELKTQVKININDPINGIDDDNDGFTDNYKGWDISNNDNDVNFKEVVVNNPNDSNKKDTLRGNGHGTIVFGMAAAATDNGLAMAGSGFKTKVLPIKTMRDVDAVKGSIADGYLGIIYAAEQGAKVINCSWGSFNSYSLLAQDAINYATYNFDALVVSAAGNDDKEDFLYPCSYENVLCVAASFINKTTQKDIKAPWATYSFMVDICAPGDELFAPYKDGYLESTNGSSYAAPIVAGAAALVRTKFKDFNALQALEQLRLSADNIDTIAGNEKYAEKMGKGRLNMLKALTAPSYPSIKMVDGNFPNILSTLAYAGETVSVFGKFVNYLNNSKNTKVTLRAMSPYVKMIDSTFTIGALKTLDTANNEANQFRFSLTNNLPANHIVYFRLGYEDENYKDYQYIRCFLNPDFITLDTNKVSISITSTGRIGFRDDNGLEGAGMVYNNKSLIFESGLMLSASGNLISDCVRSSPVSSNKSSFVATQSLRFVNNNFPGQEVYCQLIDTGKGRVGVEIQQSSYALPNSPNDKYIIVRYLIKNTSGMDFDTLRVGIYSDFDINDSDRNRADYDASTKTAFTYSSARNGLYAGVSLLSEQAVSVVSHDHLNNINGNINPTDGYTDEEKKRALFGGVIRQRAGTVGYGNDVSQTIGALLLNVKKDQIYQVGFAFLAGDNKADLLANAQAAKNIYNSTVAPTSLLSTIDSDEIMVAPNPAQGSLTIQYPQLENPQAFYIENMTGQKILESKLESNTHTLDIQRLEKGIYLLKMQVKSGMVVKKIIKN